ncbi:hypothetical protein JCM10450v2_007615 [Rhodotorula kratochvilovae]
MALPPPSPPAPHPNLTDPLSSPLEERGPTHLRLNLGWPEHSRTGDLVNHNDGERTELISPASPLSDLDDLDDGPSDLDDDRDDALDLVDDRTETSQQRHDRRRRMRRMYGGGRHRHRGLHAPGQGWDGESTAAEDEEGEGEGAVRAGEGGGVGEVAGMVLAGSLSPLPLLLPLACAQLGPGLFVPLLALASVLAWLGAVVVGVEGRYVGARSFPALASGVFPHRFKLHKLGEFLAAIYVLAGSVVRTALGVVAAAEIVVDLVVPERRRRDWERGIAVGVICATWLLVPLVLPLLLSLLGLSPARLRTPDSEYTRLSSVSTPDLSAAPPSPAFSAGPDPSSSSSSARPRARWTALLALPAWSAALLTWPLALLLLGLRLRALNRSHPHPGTAALPLPALDPHDGEVASLWPAILLTFAGPLSAPHETFFYLSSLARPSSTASAARGGHGRGFSLSAAAGAGAPLEGGGGGGRERKGEGRRNQYPLAVLLGHAGAFLLHLGWALVGALSLSPSAAAAALPAPNLLTDARLPRADFLLGAVRALVLAGVLAQLPAHAAVGLGRARRALRRVGGEGARARAARRVVARVGMWSAPAADALLARKERQMQRRLSGRRIWTDAGVFGLLGPRSMGAGAGVVLPSMTDLLPPSEAQIVNTYKTNYALAKRATHGSPTYNAAQHQMTMMINAYRQVLQTRVRGYSTDDLDRECEWRKLGDLCTFDRFDNYQHTIPEDVRALNNVLYEVYLRELDRREEAHSLGVRGGDAPMGLRAARMYYGRAY